MSTISLCMIVKNEQDVLSRCLLSAADLVDEIIIVDTGSTDATKEVAKNFTDKIYDFIWCDDFSKARNFSFSKATCDYVMWLDADDVILPRDAAKFKKLKQGLNLSAELVMMKYHVAFDEHQNPTLTYYRERLMLRSMNFVWEGAVHEAIVPRGNIIYSDVAITHQKLHRADPQRNLRIFEKLLAQGTHLDPRQQFYYARELYYDKRYPEAIAEFCAFLDGGAGWVENNISACQDLAYCYYQTGQEQKALAALVRSFCYDVPRCEICCDIGKHFLDRNQLPQAIYWFKTALSRKPEKASGAFVNPDCAGYIPCLWLCVCYDRLGDRAMAEKFNERAAKKKPDDPTVLQNRAYFNSMK